MMLPIRPMRQKRFLGRTGAARDRVLPFAKPQAASGRKRYSADDALSDVGTVGPVGEVDTAARWLRPLQLFYGLGMEAGGYDRSER
jgi:hypothetical protein